MAGKLFIRKYSGEWRLTWHPDGYASTPSFSPLPDTTLSFYFRCVYSFLREELELTLYKSGNAEMYPSLRIDVELGLYDKLSSNDVQQYKTVSSINIQKEVDIKLLTYLIMSKGGSHHKADLWIKCKMQFWNIPRNALQSDEITEYLSCDFKHLTERFATIYESGALSDVTFILGENTLPAHKFVLAAHSPVFLTMLTSDFQESRTDTITITDSTIEVFSDFLQYLYSSEIVDRTWDNVRELYKLADKYEVGILKRECQRTIPSCLTTDIVCEVLVFAYDYDDAELKNGAKEFAFEQMNELLFKRQWKDLDESHPHIVSDVCELHL